MRITEVRIKLTENSEDRLRGFCSITFDDCFVVRDLKIIEGNNGPFVAMPSRKLSTHCFKCGTKNHLRAKFCNQCGVRLKNESIPHDSTGRARLYADIAHPVNAACREMIQNRVIDDFQNELELSRQPGYISRYDEDYASDWGPEDVETVSRSQSGSPQRTDAPHVGGASAGPHKVSETPSEPVKNDGTDGFGNGIL